MMNTRKRFQTIGSLTAGFILLSSLASAATPKVATIAMQQEPPQLDSTKATDQVSSFVLGHVMEGLTRNGGKDGDVTPGIAESWTLNDKEATFKLRKNAKWSDGKPVTAQDFIYGWKVALDPKTASEYAFMLYPIKNGEAINQGKMKPDQLGVVAVDDHTLKVTLERPTGYFIGMTAFNTYLPVREDFHKSKGAKYGAEAKNLLYNGPFMLTKWVHGASLTMEKNPHYWNKAQTKLDRIEVPYITPDYSAHVNFFKDGKIDMIERLDKDTLPRAQAERFKMKSFPDGSVFFMEFNFRDGRATRNKNLRKAIQLAFNMNEYVSKVVGIPGTKPGTGLIPTYMKGTKQLFRKEYPYQPPKQNVAEAKRLIAAAKKELGGTIPPLVWLTGDTEFTAREAEYFQSVFKNVLGIELRIDKQIFKQRLAKMTAGEFDIVAAGWGPDYADPMTFADLKASWNENNRGRYNNPEVDKLIRDAQATTDRKKRMDLMAKAEKIILDDLAVLPQYERVQIYTVNNKLKNVGRNIMNPDPDLTKASISN